MGAVAVKLLKEAIGVGVWALTVCAVLYIVGAGIGAGFVIVRGGFCAVAGCY